MKEQENERLLPVQTFAFLLIDEAVLHLAARRRTASEAALNDDDNSNCANDDKEKHWMRQQGCVLRCGKCREQAAEPVERELWKQIE